MKPPRGLSAEEAAAWARLAATVVPIHSSRHGKVAGGGPVAATGRPPQPPPASVPAPPRAAGRRTSPRPGGILDSRWDRRLKTGTHDPDFTLDLHGLTLDQAHRRLESGLVQAQALGARLVLVVTGKARPVEAADRGERRGAIRAKLLDWLAAGSHADAIAAVRAAHRRHGGEGALYLVLRRER